MLWLLLLLPSVSLASLSYLSEEQEEAIRRWATAANLSNCPGADATPGYAELDFAHDAALKFFVLDAHDQDSWEVLSGLQICLEKTKGLGWLGGMDLNQAATLPFLEFAASVNIAQLDGTGKYTEINPTGSSWFGIWSKAGPMGGVSTTPRELWLSQPCNALSSAAFYQIALEVCRFTDVPALPGGWTWRDEVKAAASILAFGSFTMHSYGFKYQAEPDGNMEGWAPVDTQLLEAFAMDLLFYMLYQANVYSLAGMSTEASTLSVILTMGGTGPPDARIPIQNAMATLRKPIGFWHHEINASATGMPQYMQSAIGIILVFMKATFHKELFGASSTRLYTLACAQLFSALLAGQADAVATFCTEDSNFVKELGEVRWKVPKSISASLGLLVDLLELIVEGLYWQETEVKPANYLDPWKQKGATGPKQTECWRIPHATWHRVGALLSGKLVKLFASDLDRMSMDVSEVTESMKTEAWNDAASVAASFSSMLSGMEIIRDATKVNMCSVFKLAKACASSKPFCGPPQVVSLLAPGKVNQTLSGLLAQHDPLSTQELDKGVFKVNLSICNHTWNATVKKVAGLSNFGFSALGVKTEYIAGKTMDDASIRATISLATCDLGVRIQGSGWAVSKASDSFGAELVCPALEEVALEVNAALQMAAVASVTVVAKLGNILKDPANVAFSMNLSGFKLKCHDLVIMPPAETWYASVSYDTVTTALNASLTVLGCEIVNKFLQPRLEVAMKQAAEQMGSLSASATGRRMQQGSSVSNTCTPLDRQMIGMFGNEAFNRHLKSRLKPNNFGAGHLWGGEGGGGGSSFVSAARSSCALTPIAIVALIGLLL